MAAVSLKPWEMPSPGSGFFGIIKNNIPAIIVVIIIVVIIFFAVRFLKKRKNKSVKAAASEMLPIVGYIKDNMKKGFTKEQIKDALKKEGWPDSKINEAFSLS